MAFEDVKLTGLDLGHLQSLAQPSTDFDDIVDKASRTYNVDPSLIRAVIERESGGKSDAKSYLGAQGLMQLMPKTSKALGVANPMDPFENVMGGTKLLRQNLDRYEGREDLALAAYHGGPKVVSGGKINPRSNDGLTFTTDYAQQIVNRANQFREESLKEVALPKTIDLAKLAELGGAAPEPSVAEEPVVEEPVAEVAVAEAPELKAPPTAARVLTSEEAQQVPQEQFAQVMERGLLDVAPPEEASAKQIRAAKDFAALSKITQETVEASPEEVAAGLERGPTVTDPVVRATMLRGMDEAAKREMLAELDEKERRALELEEARIAQSAAGPALGYAALKSTPLWMLAPEESRDFAEQAMAQNPSAAMVGTIAGTLTQAIGVGGGIASLPRFKAAMQATNSIRNPVVRAAARKGLRSIQRGVAGGATSGHQQVALLADGKTTLKDALKTTGAVTLANVASVLPEGISKVLPVGTKVGGEVLSQVGADVVANSLIDKALGREHAEEETVKLLGMDVPKEYIVNAAMAVPFAVMDIDIGDYIPPKTGKPATVGRAEAGKAEDPRYFLRGAEGRVETIKEKGIEQTRREPKPVEVVDPTETTFQPTAEGGLEGGVIPRTSVPEGDVVRPAEDLAQRVQEEQAERGVPSRGTAEDADDPDLYITGRPDPEEAMRGAVAVPEPTAATKMGLGIKKALGKLLKKAFTAAGDLPKNVYDSYLRAQWGKAARSREIGFLVNDFTRGVKDAYGKGFYELPDETVFKLNSVLAGEDRFVADIPEPVRDQIDLLRSKIDATSQELIDLGIVEGPLALKIDKHKGFYLNRSYKKFSDPDWAKKVPAQTRNRAKAWLRKAVANKYGNLVDKVDIRLNTLAGKKASLQAEQLTQPVGRVEEAMLRSHRRVSEVIGDYESRLQRKVKQIQNLFAKRKRVLTSRIEELNRRKTAIWRGKDVRGPERERLIKQEQSLQERLDKLSEEDTLDDSIIEAMDATQGELANLKAQLALEPTNLPDVYPAVLKLNDRVNNILATVEKLGQRTNAEVFRTVKSLAAQTDKIVGQINKEKTDVWRGVGEDVSPETRSLDDQIASIDQRIGELATQREQFVRSGALTDDEVNEMIDQLLYVKGGPLDAARQLGKIGRKNLNILKKRADIPEPIRALYGEHKDPVINFVNSMAKMSNLIENHKFLSEVKDVGKGEFLFDAPTTKDGEQFFEEFATEGSKVWEPLNGLYTSREFKGAMESVLTPKAAPWWLRKYYQVQLGAKYAKTILSHITHLRNFQANFLVDLMNGNVDLRMAPAATKAAWTDLVGKGPKERRGFVLNMYRLGILGEGVQQREVQAVIRDATGKDVDFILGTGLTRRTRRLAKTVEKAYGLEDGIHKVFGFMQERESLANAYKKAGKEISDEQLDEEAAAIIRGTMPTYDYVPKIVQGIRRFPAVGTFVSFPAEIYRTGANVFRQTHKELSNPITRKRGLQRLAGITAAVTAIPALTRFSRMKNDISDEDDKELREYLPPWSRNSQIRWVDVDRKRGLLHYQDMGYTDPYTYWRAPLIAFMRGENVDKALMGAAVEALEAFGSEEMTTQKLDELVHNRKRNGAPIWNPEDSVDKKSAKIAEHLWKIVEPGSITSFKRMYEGYLAHVGKAEKAHKYGTVRDLWVEFKSNVTGTRTSKLSIPQSLFWQSIRFKEEVANARRAGERGEIEPKVVALRRVYTRQAKLVNNALAFGVEKRLLFSAMMDAGVSRRAAGLLMSGEVEKALEIEESKAKVRVAKRSGK